MAYTVRFESNAFEADSAMQKFLNLATGIGDKLQRFAGIKVRQTDDLPLKKLYGINGRTFEAAMDWADANFDQQMLDERWGWKGPDGVTRRKNGQIVTEPRDIIDTGALLQSKQRTKTGRSSEEFSWLADHAQGVHDGYTAKGGGVNPARPWTEPTLAEIDDVIKTIGDSLRK
jgi:hypothetical protein